MTYEQLIEQVGEAMNAIATERRVSKKIFYEVDEDINVENIREEDLERLFLGQAFDVEDTLYQSFDEGLYEMDEEERKEIFDEVFDKKFEDSLEVHLEELGYDDVEELKEALFDDDDLSLSTLGIEPFHYRKFNYRGEVQAHSLICEFNPNPSSESFFDGLRELRIPLETYLSSIVEKIEGELDENKALTDKQAKFWGMGSIDTEDDDYVDLTWPEIYVKLAREKHEQYILRTGNSVSTFEQASVIDLDKFIALAIENGPDSSFYAYFGLGSETIKELSIPACRLDLSEESHEFKVVLRDGIISCSNTYVSEDATIDGPIELRAKDITVTKEKPETRTENELVLDVHRLAATKLYEIAVIKRSEEKDYNAPFDHSDKYDQSIIQEIKIALNSVPRWACEFALENFNQSRQWFTLDQIKDRSLTDSFDLSSQLVKELIEFSTVKDKVRDDKLKRIEFLIDHLDDFSFRNSAGLGFLNIACQNQLPSQIIKKFDRPECVSDLASSNESPLSRICNALSNQLRVNPNIGDLTERSLDVLSSFTRILNEEKYAFPEGKCYVYMSSNIFVDLMKHGQAAPLSQFLQHIEKFQSDEVHQRVIKGCISSSVENGFVHTLPTLLNARNDIDYEPYILRNSSSREKISSSTWDVRDRIQMCNDIETIFRAQQAKDACMDVLGELGLNFFVKP